MVVRCPFCSIQEDKVIDSRVSKDGREIRRRRECEGCTRRYTTYERIEESMPQVVKMDGRREPFDRNKVERGLRYAVAKRPISLEQVRTLAEDVEREVSELGVAEIAARDIGERVLPKLRALDPVAYVRFASIYRDFRDLDGFSKELASLRIDDVGPGKGRSRKTSDVMAKLSEPRTVEPLADQTNSNDESAVVVDGVGNSGNEP
jgi:transcriptional repressor NrdR